MVRNFGKGGKGCKKMKNSAIENNRLLLFKDHGQEYAVVLEIFGHGRYSCACNDNTTRLCILRGSLRKGSTRIYKGDTVLVSLRDFQDGKADIIHVYAQDEVHSLINYGEILTKHNEDNDIEFCN